MSRSRSAAVGFAVVVLAACGSVSNSAAPTSTTPPVPTLPACSLPQLPAPGASSSPWQLGGPAVTALQGGPARSGFTLDDRQFTLTPPSADDQPPVSMNQAECAALASVTPTGWAIGDIARASGAAVGYGRVSIASSLTNPAGKTTYVARSGVNNNTNPRLPAATPFQHRLAWVVVVEQTPTVHTSPMMPTRAPGRATTEPEPGPAPTSHNYVVFVIDARTGSDALVYSEAQTSGGSPSVSVPAERVSVPWTLISRSADGYAGKITATVLACDGVPNPVTILQGRAALGVVVERPIGPPCSAPKEVTLPIHAAVVTADLPADIAHDPLGPLVTTIAGPENGTQHCSSTTRKGRPPIPECQYTGPGATRGVLVNVFEQDDKSTITVNVDDVLVVGPLHAPGQLPELPIASSDTAVLGPLDDLRQSDGAEFRAWRPGRADVFVPASGCNGAGANGPQCQTAWMVHVVVT